MSAFTKGPWKISGAEKITKFIDAKLRDGVMQEIGTISPTESPEQSIANANLIAAAPDLYEALEDLISCSKYPTPPENITKFEERAEAALAKARGETP